MKDWKELKLGEYIETNSKSIGKDYQYSNILYLDTGSISSNRISSLQEYSLSLAPSRAKRLVKEDDIIYSTVRPNQLHYGFITNPPKNLVVSTGFVTISCDKRKLDSKFLYFFLSQTQTTEFLHSIAEASTSAYPSLKSSDVEDLSILLPPLPEQKAIAQVLSSLDDKIELLNEQNKTLEQMAETLFRQWFVEEAEEDWEEVRLDRISNISIGRTPPRKESEWFSFNETDVKWISIKDMGCSSSYIANTSEHLTKEAIEKFRVPMIPANTVLLSFKMTVGRVKITTEPMVSNEAIAQFQLNGNSIVSVEYLYLFLKSFKYDSLGSTSSIVTAINSAMIKAMMIPIPNAEKLAMFSTKISKTFQKIKSNQSQIQTLTSLRDTLLPKLMSGELRVDMN